MADSTMSDAERIRQRRIAKLGGPPPGNESNAPTNGSAASSTPSQSNATTPALPDPTPPDSSMSQTPSPNVANPLDQFGGTQQQEAAQEKRPTPQIKVRPRPTSPVKRERDGSEKPRPTRAAEKPHESLEVWQDRMLRNIFRASLNPQDTRDAHGHQLVFLASTREDLTADGAPLLLTTEKLDGVITEVATAAPEGKAFECLLACFKRVARAVRSGKFSGPEDPKQDILKEARRLCMSYCVFTVTMPEMFGKEAGSNPLVDHLLADPDTDGGICTDFLTEASSRFEEDESIKEAIVAAAEELSSQLSSKNMLDDYQHYLRATRNLMRFPKIVDAMTQSPMWIPDGIEAQNIETSTLLGPFFKISPMQPEVAQSYFSSPKTRDRGFIANAQNASRITLRTHQAELFQMADTIVKSGPAQRARMLDWFALCVNKNHKKRAMQVDPKVVSTDGFMVNITSVLDQLCEPFMDARFGKIDRIDVTYLRRNPRVDISDETKINADQKTADEFYANKVDGANNFISEVFFLTVAAHHYGTEAAQTKMEQMRKQVKYMEKDLAQFEADRHKFVNDQRYLAAFEQRLKVARQRVDNVWSAIHATYGVLVDDLGQARSMQFMRYVIVWLMRLAAQQDIPAEYVRLPLPEQQADVFKVLPEYFLEDIVENFKFITRNIPHIITPQQAEEIMQICVVFLRSSEYVKNPGVKSGLVTILFYGCHQLPSRPNGVLGDLLIGSSFANKHLFHALMKFYIEAEFTGSHAQFFDKFNIRYEIFQVIQCIWKNTLYRENLAKEASQNTDFFVQFVNLLLNDVTFVLDESLGAFVKIHDLSKEIVDPAVMGDLTDEEKKEKQELLDDNKGKAKSYMQLTRETMEMLKLFSESLAEAFTMPEIVQRLTDMLGYNLDSMVGPKSSSLKVDNPGEYGFHPKALLADILTVYCNLGGKQRFIEAIAKDERSYKPGNFVKAGEIMKKFVLKSPDELRLWDKLSADAAEAKAAEEEEEADFEDAPDEFLDPLMASLMVDPVILPTSKSVMDRSTIRSHLLSDPNDPYNRAPLKIEDVIPDTALKERIEAYKAEKKAARQASKMDTSAG